ncbi:MAG: hypothetical protein QOE15_776 [Acidimicrobiaceae bacterium]|nr:hypothetical protein [Acidimicrobiaceae bacterium]
MLAAAAAWVARLRPLPLPRRLPRSRLLRLRGLVVAAGPWRPALRVEESLGPMAAQGLGWVDRRGSATVDHRDPAPSGFRSVGQQVARPVVWPGVWREVWPGVWPGAENGPQSVVWREPPRVSGRHLLEQRTQVALAAPVPAMADGRSGFRRVVGRGRPVSMGLVPLSGEVQTVTPG